MCGQLTSKLRGVGLLQIHTPTSWKAQQLCAECLGLLGAVDPARVEVALDPPDSLCHSTQELLTTLIVKHLVRLLRVASHIFVLDAASFAIQVTCFLSIFALAAPDAVTGYLSCCMKDATMMSLSVLLLWRCRSWLATPGNGQL